MLPGGADIMDSSPQFRTFSMPCKILFALLAVVFSNATGAAPTPVIPTVSEEQVRQFARARIVDGHDLLLGPSVPQPVAPIPGDCRTLYQQRVAMMREQLDYRRPFWDEPRHVATVLVGAVWTPAFYFLPYRALSTTLADERQAGGVAELDALRAAAAAGRCFER